MSSCNQKLLGPGGAGGQVSNDQQDSGRADLTATNGLKASAVDCRLGDGASGAEGGGERGRREGRVVGRAVREGRGARVVSGGRGRCRGRRRKGKYYGSVL